MMQLYLRVVATMEEVIGRVLGLMTLALILVQLALVLLNAVLGLGSIWLQESRIYLNALIFLGGVGYTLAHDAHVRVDVFHRDAGRDTRALVDFLGTLLFLVPFVALLGYAGLPYALQSIHAREGSTETAGIAFVYGLKSLILLFAALLALETLVMLLRNGARLFGRREEQR